MRGFVILVIDKFDKYHCITQWFDLCGARGGGLVFLAPLLSGGYACKFRFDFSEVLAAFAHGA